MRERTGDLFEAAREADALVVTTNGAVRADGCAVMGRGVAKQAADRWPWLSKALGYRLKNGNHLYVWRPDESGERFYIATFPVKHHWRETADLELIRSSVGELGLFADVHRQDVRTVVLPRLGCGNGGLLWRPVTVNQGEPDEYELVGVRDVVAPLLDDRFVVVYNGTDVGRRW